MAILNNPTITIDRSSPQGNAHYIMGTVKRILKEAKTPDLAEKYETEAKSGDYEHLCKVSAEYVNIKFIN